MSVPSVLQAVGWMMVTVGASAGLWAGLLDRRLRRYRRADVPARKYWVVPLRLRADLYTDEGARLVGKIWRLITVMYAFGIVGGMLVAVTH